MRTVRLTLTQITPHLNRGTEGEWKTHSCVCMHFAESCAALKNKRPGAALMEEKQLLRRQHRKHPRECAVLAVNTALASRYKRPSNSSSSSRKGGGRRRRRRDLGEEEVKEGHRIEASYPTFAPEVAGS